MTNPFALNQVKSPFLKWLIRKVSKIDVLERCYEAWLNADHSKRNGEHIDAFIEHSLNCLDVRSEVVNEALLKEIPAHGPFIFVSNHPLGGLDGLLLTQLLRRARPDLKVLTNELLSGIKEFEDVFIGVDVLNPSRQQHNARGIRKVAQHLGAGGALLIFPAGTVSTLRLPSLALTDAPWSAIVSKLARKYSAPVMPIFIGGRNSMLFYLSGYIHKRLRTLLLPRAMIRKQLEPIKLHLGATISASDLRRFTDDVTAMHYLRVCCKVLKSPQVKEVLIAQGHLDAVKDDLSVEQVSGHIETLGDFLLYQQGTFSLYCAPHSPLGPVMEQLAIERERTFRQVDEGTGRELDSDRFDPHYMHLFLWDTAAQKIAGGYRMGKTDEIIRASGLAGLYSHSLFEYKAKFLEEMGKTIEVGRSFITKDYQRNPAALDLLWKGIGRFVMRNPEYHTLFGCVSISRQYSSLVSAMLTETFLSNYGADDSIMRNVKPRIPIEEVEKPWTPLQIASLSGIPIINKLVGRIDAGKSIPVLIRHYLALNGRFISFTVNSGFNQSLDGLIMVDLRQSPDRYLKRYMGAAGLNHFRTSSGVAVEGVK